MSHELSSVFRKIKDVSHAGSIKSKFKDAWVYAKEWKHERLDEIDINTVNWILKKDTIDQEDIYALASIKKRANRVAG